MKPKHIAVLTVIFGVAVAALYLVNRDPAPATGSKKFDDPLFDPAPDFNAVSAIKVKAADSEVSLEKKDGIWVVTDRDDFPVNFAGKLKAFVEGVAALKVVRSREIGDSDLGRVGLNEPSATGEKLGEMGTRVEFIGEDGKPMTRLLVGALYSPPNTASGQQSGSQGRYVKLYNKEADVYVVSDALYSIEQSDPRSWIEKKSFKTENIKSVEVIHTGDAEKESFKIERENANGEWGLAGAKEGESLDPAKLGKLATPFDSESFYDILVGDDAKEENTGLSEAVTVKIETFDGFSYEAKLGKVLGASRHPVVYMVKAEIEAARTAEDGETEEEKEARDKAFAETKKRLEEKLAAESKHAGRIFVYDSWMVSDLMKKRSELLAEEEGAESSIPMTPVGPGGASAVFPGAPGGASAVLPGGISPERIVATTPPISVADAVKKEDDKAEEAKNEKTEDPVEVKESTDEAGDGSDDSPAGEGASESSTAQE